MSSLTPRIGTVVVGAGYAGLATSAALARAGLDHVVLERGQVGSSWRTQRWDSFRLNTERWMSGLSGSGFAAMPEFVGALEDAAASLPVETGVEVEAVRHVASGGFVLSTSAGVVRADHVVAANGSQRVPRIPSVASTVSGRGVEHLHTADYRNAASLVDGAVLVVGSGQSGVQIASDLLSAGRRVYLATSRVGRMPRTYRGRDTTAWLDDLGYYDERPSPGCSETALQVGAGETISLQSLARRGAVLTGRVLGADGTRLRLGDELGENARYGDAVSALLKERIDRWIDARRIDAPPAVEDPAEAPMGPMSWPRYLDLREAGIATVIWATGFGADWSWLRMPHERSVASAPTGLHFVGLPWLTRRASGILHGMPRDAEAVVARIAYRYAPRRAPIAQMDRATPS